MATRSRFEALESDVRLSWIVSYSANELNDASIAPLLVSLLQGSLMLGSFGASSYQRHFALWDLAAWRLEGFKICSEKATEPI